jgi:predicted lipoprotein with Yx(FWY)xxD motif
LTSHGMPHARGGAVAAKVGTIKAAGGDRQVTYNGHPLYYYAPDRKAGDTTGQGLNQFGAKWYVLSATGNKVDHDD